MHGITIEQRNQNKIKIKINIWPISFISILEGAGGKG